MPNQLIKNLLILLGALLYSYLFATYQLGLNALIFSIGLFLVQVFFDRSLLRNSSFRLISSTHLFIALMVVFQHSPISMAMYLLSFLLWVGYSQLPSLRFLWYGMLLGVGTMFSTPISALKDWSGLRWDRWKAVLQWGSLVVVPLALGALFFVLYYNANSDFASIFDHVFDLFATIHLELDFPRVVLFLMGLVCMGAILWPAGIVPIVENRESQWSMSLRRIRKSSSFQFSLLALKRHYLVAILSFSLLNVLLLLANALDLRYVWLDFSEKSAAELSDYVHAGTQLLIIAILLAIGVVVYFFRRNLNFYPDEKQRLRQLAYLWLLQNSILALSVGFRNYHYLNTYGLTSLRVGVMIFLLMVITGLYFTFRKIRDKKTTYYLLSANAWTMLFILTFTCLFNWTNVITHYNLKYTDADRLDVYYLCYQLSDKNLAVLKEHQVYLEGLGHAEDVQGWISRKEDRLLQKYKEQGWRGWNWADAKVVRSLK